MTVFSTVRLPSLIDKHWAVFNECEYTETKNWTQKCLAHKDYVCNNKLSKYWKKEKNKEKNNTDTKFQNFPQLFFFAHVLSI